MAVQLKGIINDITLFLKKQLMYSFPIKSKINPHAEFFIHLFATLKEDEKGLKKDKLLRNMSALLTKENLLILAPFPMVKYQRK